MSAQIVRSWHARARAYRALASDHAIFGTLARRLVATLPPDFAGAFVDVGGGFGLVTALALDAHPAARAVLVEPAAAMRELARDETSRFGARVEIVDGDAEHLPERAFAHALSSAVMHLVDEGPAFAAASRALAPRGAFTFNIWGHSFEESLGDPDVGPVWKGALDQALRELGFAVPAGVTPARPRVRSRGDFTRAARDAGLEIASIDVDEDLVPAAFHLDFAAMAPTFLPRLPPVARARVLERARAIATPSFPMRSVRVVVRKG